jgi:hypothetical protein
VPGDRTGAHVRFRADAGALFGAAHDVLGRVEITAITAAVGMALAGDAGPVRLDLGPRVEAGWIGARGSPASASVRGSNLSAAFAAASLAGAAWTHLGSAWLGLIEIEAGATLTGLDARADGRDVANASGAFASVRVGAGRAF